MKKRLLIFLVISSLILMSCSKAALPQKTESSTKNEPVTTSQNNNTDSNTQAIPVTPAANSNSDVKTPEPTKAPEKSGGTTVVNASNNERSWFYKPNASHTTPEIPADAKALLSKYNAYYVGDTNSKVIYLTFDEGYENGFTPKILDVLKANSVKAAFFVTRPYIKQQPDLIKRMVQEGHTVGNHSSTHPAMPTKTGDIDSFNKEFTDTEKMFTDVTGLEMPKYFRPPMGVYSEKSLELTNKLGYKSILWSFAHKDWEVNNQPTVQVTHDRVIKGSHNGEIMLLHAVSKSDTDALDSIIKDLKAEGYKFETLDKLP